MILYHGSNVAVIEPMLLRSRRNLDFGAGFYTTSDYAQACRWAARTARIRKSGSATVTSFSLSEGTLQQLNVLRFSEANVEWLRYVTYNRTKDTESVDYDLVIGPVANDQTIRTINDYISGRFSEEIAIQLLKPQKLSDQYTFKTKLALDALTLAEVNKV